VATSVPDALQNPFFRRFFSEGTEPPSERVERGTGSGFVLSKDGRIITNAHVVEGADVVDVTLKDGRTFEGKVLGVDALTDVAVIQIQADDGLPTAPIGSAETLIPGQWAIAIGNPLGLDNTVTVGIVSAIGRSSAQVGISDKRVQFIQTDAAINPGNSGGPLLNDRGEVIGINTAIRANAQGLGFAIPIETAIRVATQISTSGSAEHPFLGIQMLDLSPDIKAELNASDSIPFPIDRDTGVFVVQVLPDSPAAAGGLEAGDIIQKIGQTPIKSAADVQAQVENSSIGAPLKIEVLRNKRVLSLEVQPGRFPEPEAP
jgi:S1-C subfamily serine protease